MRPPDHVDGVDLEQRNLVEDTLQRAHVRPGGRPVGEPLGRERDPARLRPAERRPAHGMSRSFSRTAYITASIREWSCSFSKMLRTWFLTVFSLMKSSLAMSRLASP